jgi:hypothetical protein
VAHSMATITVQAGSALHVLSTIVPNGSGRLPEASDPAHDGQAGLCWLAGDDPRTPGKRHPSAARG